MAEIKKTEIKKAETTKVVEVKKPAKVEVKREKIEFVGTEEGITSALSIILGKEVSKENIIEAIQEAGKKYKVEAGNIVEGCGGVAVCEVMKRIVEVHNA